MKALWEEKSERSPSVLHLVMCSHHTVWKQSTQDGWCVSSSYHWRKSKAKISPMEALPSHPTDSLWAKVLQLQGSRGAVSSSCSYNHTTSIKKIEMNTGAANSVIRNYIFGKINVLSVIIKEEGPITYSAAYHQGGIKRAWLHFWWAFIHIEGSLYTAKWIYW